MPSYRRAIFADPIHRVMDFGSNSFTEKLTRIIDDRAFQRMRRISQLGLASHVFPGATHTRFLHSLGAAYLAKLVLAHLETNAEAELPLESKVRQRLSELVVVSALVHDVGHGPFSHAFERIRLDGKGKQEAPSHEDWGRAIIERTLKAPILQADIEPGHVAAILAKEGALPKEVPLWAQQIVSSQLDVDRLDYLPRDAHFAGVSMGRIDIEYLIRSITIALPANEVPCLGVSSRGVRPFEAFALARHHMNRSVYFHPKVRVFEFMMEEFLRSALNEKLDGVAVPEYLRALHSWRPSSVDKASFIDEQLSNYCAMTEDGVWQMVDAFAGRRSRAGNLAYRLLTRQPLAFDRVRPGMRGALKSALDSQGIKSSAYNIVPVKSTVYDQNSSPVLVVGEDRRCEAITEESLAIAIHSDRPESSHLFIMIENEDKLRHIAGETLESAMTRLRGLAKRPSAPPPANDIASSIK